MTDHINRLATEHITEIPSVTFGSGKAVFVQTGPKIECKVEQGMITVRVNINKYKSIAEAKNVGFERLVREESKTDYVKLDLYENSRFLAMNPVYAEVLSLQKIKSAATKIKIAQQSAFTPDFENLSNEKSFWRMCRYYALHKKLPDDTPDELREIFDTIPKSNNNVSILDELLSQKYTKEVELELFDLLKTTAAKVKQLDQSSAKQFEYRPQVGNLGESEPIDPNKIETKVTPFYGGYFRGYACRFDPTQHKIVQNQVATELYESESEDEDQVYKHLYETVFNETKENNIELPYGAIIDAASLTPGYVIHRADNGTFFLKRNTAGGSANGISDKIQSLLGGKSKHAQVTFRFNVDKRNQFAKDEPDDQPEIWGEFDDETNAFLEQLKQDSTAGLAGKAKKIIKFVRTKFTYPANMHATMDMDSKYLNSGGKALHKMCEHKIANCYWSNIFAGQMMARLGIQHRVIAGHYITKDPRFEFAAVAGTGHAWSEWWNGTEWEREDATPAKEKDDSDQSEEGESLDGDFGNNENKDQEEQEELTPEQIQEIVRELLNNATVTPVPPTPEQLFEKEKGVSYAKWKQVEGYIERVNKMPVPAESSITRKPSTIEKEWKSLFEVIYQRRKIPVQAFKGPVPQSEGDYLDDPVEAYIDVVAGESDPSGYKKESTKTKELIFTREFEDDAILDLTASMEGEPADEQRKMLLSGLYNLMNLNRRLNLTKFKNKMRAPVHLKSTVLVFKGDTVVAPLQENEAEIDEKTLCRIFDQLELLQEGSGNLKGALAAYESRLTGQQIKAIKAGRLTKVLTVVTDGAVNDPAGSMAIIKRLREKGVIVNGLGFGTQAQSIKVVCHDPKDPEAAEVAPDVTKAISFRQKMLTNAMKKL